MWTSQTLGTSLISVLGLVTNAQMHKEEDDGKNQVDQEEHKREQIEVKYCKSNPM